MRLSNFLTSDGCTINAVRVDCLYINKANAFTPDQEAESLEIAEFEMRRKMVIFKHKAFPAVTRLANDNCG